MPAAFHRATGIVQLRLLVLLAQNVCGRDLGRSNEAKLVVLCGENEQLKNRKVRNSRFKIFRFGIWGRMVGQKHDRNFFEKFVLEYCPCLECFTACYGFCRNKIFVFWSLSIG